ncbi:probable ribose-5-phosphate isomerase 4, chloroplastic [Magnolia sinica]|uniref:probable ribose-5-phosphate isomerase 4, chloroplastic n=1 Tax=Magnolia sinica TaxID=86752 RepID=UPI002658149B|nr:probable ribose-5-phosphate isomerase 4, chloroplastic [Magnolia sinica]
MASVALHFPPSCRNFPSKPRRKYFPPKTWRCLTTTANASDADPLLEAAKHTVDTYIESGTVVGLGSGRASGMVIQYLGQQLRKGALKNIVGIPTSISSASEAAKAGIPLEHYPDSPQIDFAVNDADIIEEGTLTAVIGGQKLQGGESLLQEMSIIKAAGRLAFIVTEMQYKRDLEGSIPVLVQSDNWMETAEEIDDLFLGDAEVWRRPTIGLAGPMGGEFPLVTREGHNVLDLIFTSPIADLAQVAESLDKIDGVVDHGVISGIPCIAVIASKDGLQIVDSLPSSVIKGL